MKYLILLFLTTLTSGTLWAGVCNLEAESPQGCRPPQFINVNFDGSYNLSIWQDLMNFGDNNNAKFAFYVSGVTFLHKSITDADNAFSKNRYITPGFEAKSGKVAKGRSRVLWARNGSDSSTTTSTLLRYKKFGIGQDDQISQIQARYITMYDALQRGHEIGAHGNGHFYGGPSHRTLPSYKEATSGQKKRSEFAFEWTREEWNFEFSQFQDFTVDTALQANLPNSVFGQPLEVVLDILTSQMSGFRAPYLSTNNGLFGALKDSGYAYDASTISSSHLIWPKKSPEGIWKYPIPMLKLPGYKRKVLGMDFNFHVSNVSESQAYQGWKNAFMNAYNGNRSPMTLGMHVYRMGPKNDPSKKGVYLRAMKQFLKEVCSLPEVICGTYNELTQFLESHGNQIAQFESGSFEEASLLVENPLRKTSFSGSSNLQFLPSGNGLRGFTPPQSEQIDASILENQNCSEFHKEDTSQQIAI